jgi:hypothetical protein
MALWAWWKLASAGQRGVAVSQLLSILEIGHEQMDGFKTGYNRVDDSEHMSELHKQAGERKVQNSQCSLIAPETGRDQIDRFKTGNNRGVINSKHLSASELHNRVCGRA